MLTCLPCLQNAPVDECVLATMRWGLVPSWFKETDPHKMQYSTSNCRSENILEKKSYKVHSLWCTAKLLCSFPALSGLLTVLGALSKIFSSPWRTPWLKDNAVSSWQMGFMSGWGRTKSSSPSSYTSLRLKVTPWPHLVVRTLSLCARQRRPPPTWQRFVFFQHYIQHKNVLLSRP